MKLKLPLKGVTALFCHSFNWPLEDVCCNVPCVPDLNLQQQSNNSGDENWEWNAWNLFSVHLSALPASETLPEWMDIY